MTIKVTVTNSDQREGAVIVVQHMTPNGEPAAGQLDRELKGGESAEVWVHSGLQLAIKEVRQ